MTTEQDNEYREKARLICRAEKHNLYCECGSIHHALRMAFYDGAAAGIHNMSEKLREVHMERASQ